MVFLSVFQTVCYEMVFLSVFQTVCYEMVFLSVFQTVCYEMVFLSVFQTDAGLSMKERLALLQSGNKNPAFWWLLFIAFI